MVLCMLNEWLIYFSNQLDRWKNINIILFQCDKYVQFYYSVISLCNSYYELFMVIEVYFFHFKHLSGKIDLLKAMNYSYRNDIFYISLFAHYNFSSFLFVDFYRLYVTLGTVHKIRIHVEVENGMLSAATIPK